MGAFIEKYVYRIGWQLRAVVEGCVVGRYSFWNMFLGMVAGLCFLLAQRLNE